MAFRYNPISGVFDVVDTSGGPGTVQQIDTDGTPATPAAGIIQIIGDGTVTTNGAGDVVTISLTGIVPVTLGGSGRASSTAYAVICGGTTSTAAHQSVASVGTAGQVLTSAGAGALPTWGTAGTPSPLVAKGDIYTFTTTNARLPVGTDGNILAADSAETTGLKWIAATAGDVTAAANITDNSLVRGDGGAKGVQGSLVILDDTANMSAVATITVDTGGALRTAASAGNTLLLQARDVDGAVYTTFATLTANDTPTMDLSDAVTKSGGYIYRAGGTDVPVADGGTGISSATAFAVICGGTTSTDPFQPLAALGAAGEVLTSNGAGALPSFQAVAGTGDVTAAANITDNSIVRGDGGAKGVQDSGILIDDTDNVSGMANLTLTAGSAIQTAASAGNTLLLQARDVDGAVYTTFATLTANNTPTMDLDDAVTKSGGYIYRAGGTDVPVADGGTGVSSTTAYAVLCGGTTSTNPLQSIASVGSAGEVLTSNGAGALPTFQAAGGGGMTYSAAAGATQAMTVNSGYISTRSGTPVAFTLPDTASVGQAVAIVGQGDGGWTLAVNSGEQIHWNSVDTTVTTGTLASTNRYNCVLLRCVVADTEWTVETSQGNITTT